MFSVLSHSYSTALLEIHRMWCALPTSVECLLKGLFLNDECTLIYDKLKILYDASEAIEGNLCEERLVEIGDLMI